MVFALLPELARFPSLAACCCALSTSALAAGAVAVAVEPNGPGWSAAYSVRETPSVAKAKALEGCRKRTIENKFDPDLCTIVSEFKNRCTAASINPDGPGEGWAVADSIDAARKQAQDKCVASAGGDETKCNAAYADCDFISDEDGKDKSGKRPGGRPRANTPR